jgi:hypothetical protein
MPSQHHGLRCIIVTRTPVSEREVSSGSEIDTLREFARQQSMVEVAQVHIVGATVQAVERLVQRKEELNDFDAILVTSRFRLTNDLRDALGIDFELRRSAIRLVSATEPTVESDYSWVLTFIKTVETTTLGEILSTRIKQARRERLSRGEISHTSHTPAGIDKMYSTRARGPLWIVRTLPGKRRVQLNAQTMEVVREFTEGRGYVKTDEEFVTLIPGDEASRKTIRIIFEWHYADNVPIHRIVRRLNETGVPPLKQTWTYGSVQLMLRNPIYIGRAVVNRQQFKPPTQQSQEKSIRANRQLVPSSPNQWLVIRYPELENAFLPPDLQLKVRRHIERDLGVDLSGGAA